MYKFLKYANFNDSTNSTFLQLYFQESPGLQKFVDFVSILDYQACYTRDIIVHYF